VDVEPEATSSLLGDLCPIHPHHAGRPLARVRTLACLCSSTVMSPFDFKSEMIDRFLQDGVTVEREALSQSSRPRVESPSMIALNALKIACFVE
jgi:hypothetical protein